MTGSLKHYNMYKDSGVPWLGEIPAHWDTTRMKYLFEERIQKGYPDEPMLAATQTKGVIPKKDYENRTVEASKDLHLLKLVEVGDYVISLRSFQGGIEYTHHRGIISPAYTILTPKTIAKRGYYEHLFKSNPFVSALSLFVTGIREGQNIDYDKLSRSPLPVPPLEEQMVIGGFLNASLSHVNRFIRAKQRLIKLLNEQKQAIIHQAVTRGLDPQVRMKPSGIEWLGEVPEHWEIVSLGSMCNRIVDGPHLSPAYVESDGVMFISARNIKSDRWAFDDAKFISKDDYELFNARVKPEDGDVLYTKGGTTGVARAVDFDEQFQIWVHVAVLKLKRELISPFFLAHALNSPRSYEQSQLFTRGATNQDLGLSRMAKIRFPLPTLDEQSAITSFIDNQHRRIELAATRAKQELDIIREYRTRLIADVVTGKLDVREIDVPDIFSNDLIASVEYDDLDEAEEMYDTEESADADE